MRLAVVVGVLAVHNLGANLWVGERAYVPVNLVTAAVVAAVAGVPLSWGGDAKVASAAALAVLVAVAGLAAAPATRPLFADRRMAGVDGWGTAWRALVRIPLGTVVLGEVAFRGVLPALSSPVAASVLFGLWHVVPAARTLDRNGLATGRRARVLAVGAAVAVTTMVGLVLCALRAGTGGLLAPALVHAAANGGAVVASYVVLRRRPAAAR